MPYFCNLPPPSISSLKPMVSIQQNYENYLIWTGIFFYIRYYLVVSLKYMLIYVYEFMFLLKRTQRTCVREREREIILIQLFVPKALTFTIHVELYMIISWLQLNFVYYHLIIVKKCYNIGVLGAFYGIVALHWYPILDGCVGPRWTTLTSYYQSGFAACHVVSG